MSRLRLTVRARLSLLYIGLFAGCGAVVVTVSYTQVARLPAQLPSQGQSPGKGGGAAASKLAGFAAQCRSAEQSDRPDPRILAKCAAYFQQQGAQGQRSLTLSHLLQYSLITLAVVVALAAILGWIFAGRALRPVQRIAAAARAASEHNLSARVAPTGPRDELRELAETFDEMLGRLQAAFEGRCSCWRATSAGSPCGRRSTWPRWPRTSWTSWVTGGVTGGCTPCWSPRSSRVIRCWPSGLSRTWWIFQPFERLSDRTSRDGFGLGLAIVASIAAIHGGTAVACPRDDGGLSVTVTMPSPAMAEITENVLL